VNEERAAWLRERRSAVETQYDLEAAEYDEHPYPVALHVAFIDRLLATCPPGGIVLDAPCGTGQYFPQVAASGRRVAGVDQSAGMLAQARQRAIAEHVEQIGLQELAFVAAFDGAMTVDAMENVPPEDWPVVVANIHRALKPGGHYYLTLEEVSDDDVEVAFRALQESGAPAVRGEVIEGDVAGYHFYPGRKRALEWLADAGFAVVAEDAEWNDDWGYRHLLVRRDG
jgi:SAM-dependent methyltransferase